MSAQDAAPATGDAAPETSVALSVDPPGREVLTRGYRRRLGVPVLTDRVAGWLWPLAVTALAALLRFWDLGRIQTLIFDETYYVKGAWTLLNEGTEMGWPNEPDPAFQAGDVNGYLDSPDFVVHPTVGKWVIALGMALFGAEDPAAWRFGTALVGTLAVLVLARTTRRLLGSTLLGTLAGLLLAVEGTAIAHSRVAILDGILMFFVVAAFACLVADRFRARSRLAAWAVDRDLAARAAPERPSAATRLQRLTAGLGPRLGPRWWRLAAGLMLGLACSVKWSGAYFLAVFGIVTVVWDWWARRSVGAPRWALAGLVRDAIPAFFALVGTTVVVYLASWISWWSSGKGWGLDWAADNPATTAIGGLVPDPLRSLLDYHRQMWSFHTSLDSPHDYMSHPAGWLLQLRPTSFFYQSSAYGEAGCEVEKCSAAITSLGNPVLWWLATAALVVCAVAAIVRRDGRPLAILAGVAAGWLPWFAHTDRTIFTFYTVVFAPFMVMALVYAIGLALGPRDASRDRRFAAGIVVTALVTLIVLVSAFFWPLWSGEQITYDQWRSHMWLPGWV